MTMCVYVASVSDKKGQIFKTLETIEKKEEKNSNK